VFGHTGKLCASKLRGHEFELADWNFNYLLKWTNVLNVKERERERQRERERDHYKRVLEMRGNFESQRWNWKAAETSFGRYRSTVEETQRESNIDGEI